MTFHPPTTRRERILAFGPAGGGKSTAYMSIAELLYRTNTPNRLHVWDHDVTVEALEPEDGHLKQWLDVKDVDHYDDWKRESRVAKQEAASDKNDWLVVDMASDLYSKSRSRFYEAKFGQTIDEFLVNISALESKEAAAKTTGAYGSHWDAINHLYDAVFGVIHRYPGHVFVCCEERQLSDVVKGSMDAESKSIYEKAGVMPAGRNSMTHAFHTVARFVHASGEKYVMSTLKDRKRGLVKGVVVPKEEDCGFAAGYLMGVAGWIVD